MVILLVSHLPFVHLVYPFPPQYGGKLVFQGIKHDALPRPVIEAIETAHQSLVEFFPVRITGQDTSLDYQLIPSHGRQIVTMLEAPGMRSLMLANIEQILLAHRSLLRFTDIRIQTLSSR